jgi:hypothetical protein
METKHPSKVLPDDALHVSRGDEVAAALGQIFQ